jgi:diguanylate cyclase (GGDEF)-like protein
MTGDRFIEDAIETVARTRTPVQVETTLPGQRPRRLLVQLGAAASEDDRSVLIVAVDITAQFERERSLMFEATHDQLTGLANRALVRRAVRDSLARFKRYDEAFALIYLDLDSFKPLNDRLGHAAGDSVLRDLAGRWDRLVRSPDVLGRIGGDEFVAVMQHAGDLEGANRLAGRLVGALDQPFVIGTRVVDVSVTAGVVLPPADADVDAALALADRAMYSHKPEPDELPVQRTEPGFMRHG